MPVTSSAPSGDGAEPASNGAAEYIATIEALRRVWMAERLAGESVADWLQRTGRRKGILA